MSSSIFVPRFHSFVLHSSTLHPPSVSFCIRLIRMIAKRGKSIWQSHNVKNTFRMNLRHRLRLLYSATYRRRGGEGSGLGDFDVPIWRMKDLLRKSATLHVSTTWLGHLGQLSGPACALITKRDVPDPKVIKEAILVSRCGLYGDTLIRRAPEPWTFFFSIPTDPCRLAMLHARL